MITKCARPSIEELHGRLNTFAEAVADTEAIVRQAERLSKPERALIISTVAPRGFLAIRHGKTEKQLDKAINSICTRLRKWWRSIQTEPLSITPEAWSTYASTNAILLVDLVGDIATTCLVVPQEDSTVLPTWLNSKNILAVRIYTINDVGTKISTAINIILSAFPYEMRAISSPIIVATLEDFFSTGNMADSLARRLTTVSNSPMAATGYPQMAVKTHAYEVVEQLKLNLGPLSYYDINALADVAKIIVEEILLA